MHLVGRLLSDLFPASDVDSPDVGLRVWGFDPSCSQDVSVLSRPPHTVYYKQTNTLYQRRKMPRMLGIRRRWEAERMLAQERLSVLSTYLPRFLSFFLLFSLSRSLSLPPYCFSLYPSLSMLRMDAEMD